MRARLTILLPALMPAILVATSVAAADSAPLRAGAIVSVLAGLVIIMLAARLGALAVERVRQPAVLGELVIGVILGNLSLVGLGWFDPIKTDATINVLAELGVILLLFTVGLESRLADMMEVGPAALLVASLGVITPFFLGWGVAAWFFPEHSIYMHVFVGAALTATSVGITARVMKDLGRLGTPEARIILGAAVIDDVMGLLVLAIVAGMIQAANTGQSLSSAAILWLAAKAVLFLGGATVLGRFLYPPAFRVASFLRVHGMLLIVALCACFGSAWLAAKVGLAPIVGAFAAGLVLDETAYRDLDLTTHRLEELLEPIVTFLVPIFFILMGMRVGLETLLQPSVVGFSAALTLAAILGKQTAGLGVINIPQASRLTVGLGMIPRGEVGLIFAGIGVGLSVGGERIIGSDVYSAIVLMVIVTTFVTPPLLAWAFRRRDATCSDR